MDEDIQLQIEALSRLYAARPDVIPPKPKKIRARKKRKPATWKPAEKYDQRRKEKPKIEKIERSCLRCGNPFVAHDRFHRMCSSYCRDGGYYSPPDNCGDRVEAKLY